MGNPLDKTGETIVPTHPPLPAKKTVTILRLNQPLPTIPAEKNHGGNYKFSGSCRKTQSHHKG